MQDKKKAFVNNLKFKIKEEVKEKGIKNLSHILEKAKQKYLKEIIKFGIKDPEQSWKPFKGKILEEIILDCLINEIENSGFRAVKGAIFEKDESKLSECLSKVKRGLVVDYGEFGMHLPDADIVIFDSEECKPFAIISSKTTLRERIAQTGYWFLKLKSSKITKNIRVFFITLDEDGDLIVKYPAKKGRAIAEVDTDGTFVITTKTLEESHKIKGFEKLLEEIEKLK